MAGNKRPGKGGEARRREQDVPPPDHLWDALVDNWPHVLGMYRLCEDRRPIIVLYDIQEKRVYVYPYREFKAEMSEPSQRSLEEEQRKAAREGKFVVFIRDNEQRRLVSYSLDPE